MGGLRGWDELGAFVGTVLCLVGCFLEVEGYEKWVNVGKCKIYVLFEHWYQEKLLLNFFRKRSRRLFINFYQVLRH